MAKSSKHTHHVHHDSKSNASGSNEGSKSKVNLPLLSFVAIIAIILIVSMTVSLKNKIAHSDSDDYVPTETQDAAGQASSVLVDDSLCKLIVGRTTIYDDTTLAVTLATGEHTYYGGFTIRVDQINQEGCVVDVNGNSEYLAVGQIQRLGSVYVTIKGVSN
ncbi:MAG TPA: hypothetical protein VEC16_02790 [Alphaproteobacteria bacterium]|nr:hypothetical protein [Alphaproteobacteria bacterium]